MSADPRLPELYAEFAEVPPDERASRLAILAESEPGLARELLELLVAGERNPARLELPALDRLAGIEASSAPPPTVVGSYRIVREIGRGGMGRVYLAEQETTAFRRRVALKLLAATELNADAVRRFREEVRILASLEHPGIARFLDGGRADDGTWFLALEYVEGEDLLTAARRRALPLERLIRLFVAVLDAVSYAHERHVVHRDLKPSNILVTAEGAPKLLDFGISKLFDPGLGENATLTRTELRAFTPAYASPEQFRGGAIGPASDVYSAGVLLYELLTGVRPFGSRASSRADLERAVLEEDPEPPSTAARRSGDGRRERTDGRSTEEGRGMRPRLGRQLDAICLKALRKDPAERYASAAEFAADLRRYLDNGPVAAFQGEWRYRLRRFARGKRRALGASVAAATAVAVAWTVLNLAPEPRRSATAGAGAGVTAGVTQDPVALPFPFSPGAAPPIDEAERRFAAAPASVEAGAAYALRLQREGRAKEAALIVARLRQIPGKEEDPLTDYVDALGGLDADQPQRALVLLGRALAGAIAGGRGELVGQIRATRGRMFSRLGRREEARTEMERARAAFVAAGDNASLARVLNDLAVEEALRGDLATAEKLLEQALEATRAASPGNRGAAFLGNLANLAAARGRPDLAETKYVEVIAIARESARPFRLGFLLCDFSEVLRDLGRPAEADRLLDESIARLRQTDDQTSLAGALFFRGRAEAERLNLAGVGALVDEIEAIAVATGDMEPLAKAEGLAAELAVAAGDVPAARRHFQEGARLLRATAAADSAPDLELRLAQVELEARAAAAGRRIAEAAIAPFRGHGDRALLFLGETVLARAAAAEGRPEEARRRLQALGEEAERTPSFRLRIGYLAARAATSVAEGDPVAARRDLESAIALARQAQWRLTELRLRHGLAGLPAPVLPSAPTTG